MANPLPALIREAFELDTIAPDPQLKGRIFSEVEAEAARRSAVSRPRLHAPEWILGLAAVVIAVALVATLLLALSSLTKHVAPATHPSPTASQAYLNVVYTQVELVDTSVHDSASICMFHQVQCRERTLAAKATALQFKSELDKVQAPPQFEGFDRELKQGLDDLVAALDDRVAAIDAGDVARWDASNPKVRDIVWMKIDKAVAKMTCWPKGVPSGDELGCLS